MTTNDQARVATLAECDRLARLLHDFNTEFGVASPGPEVLTRRLTRLIDSSEMFAVVAGQPAIGCALVTLRSNVWTDGPVALLDELYVVPEHRNGGIGGRIMTLVVERCREHGAELIEINVDEGDTDAQRFYERDGFTVVDPDTGERALYLYRELA